MSHPIFEESTSPLVWSNDGRMQIVKQGKLTGNAVGYVVTDDNDQHVELFTLKREIADAFIAGYDYRERLNRDGVEHRANIAKLQQLARDADAKAKESNVETDMSHWAGVRDGLRRAITVLEGRG